MKYLIIIIAVIFPLITLAENSIKENIRNAERSPLFQQKFNPSQISAKGLDEIKLHNGANLEFKKYTELTRLDQHEKFKPLMNTSNINQYLKGAPSYTENILQLEDRLIVERHMNVSLKSGVCKQQNLPDAVNELCFVSSHDQVPTETQNYLENLRQKLQNSPADKVVKNDITVAQLRDMDDEQLLDTLLNSDDREISIVSVLPTEIHNTPIRSDLWNTSQKIKASNFNAAVNNSTTNSFMSNSQLSQLPTTDEQPRNQVFPKKYFLTGFTLGREMTDTFEVQLAPATWVSDRYYVRFEYEFSAGFGLRFPFSVSVESQATNNSEQNTALIGHVMVATTPRKNEVVNSRRGTPTNRKNEVVNSRRGTPTNRKNEVVNSRRGTPSNNETVNSRIRDHRPNKVNQADQVAGENTAPKPANPVTHADLKISVAPVNVEANGSPAYPAVNLAPNKYFDGKEFVLKFHAGCKFKASIPGDDINLNCPTVDFDKSRDIDPVLGDDRAKLATLWLNGSVTGLTITAWAGKASLDFGIESSLTNGRVRFNANGYNNTLIDDRSNYAFLFEDENVQQFKASNDYNNSVAFNLDSPSYGFDFELRPVVRAKFNLDLGIKKLKKTLGPYSLDALSLTVGGFSMGHHEGTVRSHIYIL